MGQLLPAAHLRVIEGEDEALDPARRARLLAPLLTDSLRAVRLVATSELAGAPPEFLKPYQLAALDSGLVEYRETMAYSLDFAASGYNLGNLEARLGDLEEAERYYRLALGIDDLFLPARMNLAVLLSSQGRNTEAEQLLREGAIKHPESGDIAYSLGLLLVEMQRPELALEWLARSVEIQPGNSRAHYNYGLLLAQMDRLDEARLELEAALALEPGHAEYLRGLAYLEQRVKAQRE